METDFAKIGRPGVLHQAFRGLDKVSMPTSRFISPHVASPRKSGSTRPQFTGKHALSGVYVFKAAIIHLNRFFVFIVSRSPPIVGGQVVAPWRHAPMTYYGIVCLSSGGALLWVFMSLAAVPGTELRYSRPVVTEYVHLAVAFTPATL